MERFKQDEARRDEVQSAARSARDTPRWVSAVHAARARPFAVTLSEFGGAQPISATRLEALTRAAPSAPPGAPSFSRTLAFNGWVGGERASAQDASAPASEPALGPVRKSAVVRISEVSQPAPSAPPDSTTGAAAARKETRANAAMADAAMADTVVAPSTSGAVPAAPVATMQPVSPALVARAAAAMAHVAHSARARKQGPRKLEAQAPLFRAEALAAYQRGERAASVLRMTSVSGWALLLALGSVLAIGLAVTVVGRVEETSPARGVLRAAFGVQPAITAIGGTVREVHVQAGARVAQGDVIARLDATPLEAALAEAEQRLASVEAQWQGTKRALEANRVRGAALLAARIDLLEQRKRQQERLTALRDRRAARIGDDALRDVVEAAAREESVEAAAGARAELLRIREELSALRLSIVTEESEYAERIASGDERVSEARSRRDGARALLEQTYVRAPIAGKIDALRAYPGKVVQAADWLARVVRDAPPETLVAFVPERDAAFLRVGAIGSVAIDQLPAGEFGQLSARVTRVGEDLADPSELVAALGEGAPSGPHVRTELALIHDATFARLKARVRPGTLVTTRIGLRERRLLAIVFEPARRLFR